METLKLYKPFGSFILRSPRYPFSKLNSIDKYADFFHEDLRIASKNLSAEIERDPENSKIKETLYKYWSRACSRSTPFGLFSCVSTGAISDKDDIIISSPEKVVRHTRLDMNYLCALINYLESLDVLRRQLVYFANDSIYKIGERLRYIEYRFEATKRTHYIQEVDDSDYLQRVLALAREGATFDHLVGCLTSDEIAEEEARDFILELINNQLLKSEIEPNITGPDTLQRIISIISKKKGASQIVASLEAIQNNLNRLDKSLSHSSNQTIYQDLEDSLSVFPIEFNPNSIIQVDTYRPTEKSMLSIAYVNEIEKAISFLFRLHYASRLGSPILEFKKAFAQRYENQEIPLLEALDENIGIGYPPNSKHHNLIPLLDGYLWGPGPVDDQRLYFSSDELIILRKHIASGRFAEEIELTDADCPKGTDWDTTQLCNTISAMCQIYKDTDVRVYLKSLGGPTASSLIGRFCYLDESVSNVFNDIVDFEKENTKDGIIAEIVHLPESRIGNISSRSCCRNYEIHYLAHSCLQGEWNIPASDLTIRIINDRLQIRSQKLGKEVYPILSNAHNYVLDTTPVYHFLCDYQHVNRREVDGLYTNNLLQALEYLPRIRYGKVLLSLRTWLLVYDKIFTGDLGATGNQSIDILLKWCRANTIPRLITIKASDNCLLIDLLDPTCCSILTNTLRKKKQVIVEEFLYNDKASIVRDDNDRYCSEFIIPFHTAK